MLNALIVWWKEQIRDLIPASLRIPQQNWRRTLVVVVNNSPATTADFFLLGRGREIPLGRHDLLSAALRETLQRLSIHRRIPVVLRVQPDLFLDRTTVVPCIAERDLQRVIGYDLDRLTPFQPEEVFWTCLITKRDPTRNRLHVRVNLVPRCRVQPVLDALQNLGVVPTQIEVNGGTEPVHAIRLNDGQAKPGWLGARATTYALAGCAVLATVAIALPFILQSVTGANLDRQIGGMKPQVAEAEGLRKKIAARVTMSEALATARGQVGAPLQYIALLTDILPDDTYLTTISLKQRKLAVSGHSAAAARLIGAMAANPLIHDPAFTAPVTRDETNGGEAFSIRAELG